MNDTDNAEEFIENVTFDELRVGQSARLSRAVSREDITAFAAISGDVNPAHANDGGSAPTLGHRGTYPS